MYKTSKISDITRFGKGKETLVVDMGGSAVKAGLFQDGKMIEKGLWRHDYKNSCFAAARSDLLSKLKEICSGRADLVGLGIAGLLSCDGTLFRSTVLTSFTGSNIGQFVAKKFGAESYTQDNDADCGAIGEHYYIGTELFYVVIGSGIGSACVDSGGKLLYPVRIDRNIPFVEEMNHPISDIGLRSAISRQEIADTFVKMGIMDHGLSMDAESIQLGSLGSAVGVGNILQMLWKGKFFGEDCKKYYMKYLEENDGMLQDLFSERYAARTMAKLAKNGEPRSMLAYRLMGRFLGKAISRAEKILYEDHGRYFQVRLAGNILDSRELFWPDMASEIEENGVQAECVLSEAYSRGVNPNMLGAYLRVNREAKFYG
ncbi:MAG: hypothetical protein WC788_06910 [Candidatus Paceibacterota bacterium]|jgi:hypothetical protein